MRLYDPSTGIREQRHAWSYYPYNPYYMIMNLSDSVGDIQRVFDERRDYGHYTLNDSKRRAKLLLYEPAVIKHCPTRMDASLQSFFI